MTPPKNRVRLARQMLRHSYVVPKSLDRYAKVRPRRRSGFFAW